MSDWKRADTDWLHDARWGMMTHYLADLTDLEGAGGSCEEFWREYNERRFGIDPPPVTTPEQWNRRVESVDAAKFAQRVADTGAGYLVLTIGQTSGFYCSPNATYDGLVGISPSCLSRRDLIADIAVELAKRNVRTITYMPAGPPAMQRQAVEALRCTPKWDASGWGIIPGTYLRRHEVDERLSDFQRNWEAVIREWSLRWGKLVSGWWVDGAYFADKMYRHEDAPNFRTFAEAMKSGNPDAVVAFNPGVMVYCITPYEDYTAGESNSLWTPNSGPGERFMGGAQIHVMTFLGEFWCTGNPRFGQELACSYTRYLNSFGAVITWDVPVRPDGTIRDEFLRQLEAIGKKARS